MSTDSSTPADTAATTATTPTVSTADKVLDAVRAHPGATAAEIADAAGLGRSTAAKTLAALAAQGQVSRTPGIRDGGTRAPDQWHPAADPAKHPLAEPSDKTGPAEKTGTGNATPARKRKKTETPKPAHAKAEDSKAGRAKPGRSKPAAAADRSADSAAKAGGGQRMKSGELRGQVEQFLADHPEEHYTPTALGHLLGRSSGAIANALEKLVAADYAVLVTPRPRSYRSAPPE